MLRDFQALLASALEGMPASFDRDELAFLALTSKIELPIRDRLSYALFRQLPDCSVAREWKRIDLAVLSGDQPSVPLMLLQAKALYTFDLVGDAAWTDRYPAMVETDVAKLRSVAGLHRETQLFTLMLVTHPAGPIKRELREVAKYSSGIAKAVRAARGDIRAVAAEARRFVDQRLRELAPMRAIEIQGGQAYGVPIEIHCTLLGPIEHV